MRSLTDEEERDLAAVCEHYLAHTVFAEADDCSLHPEARSAILRRRAVCELITGGGS
jgi:hypothetical protein